MKKIIYLGLVLVLPSVASAAASDLFDIVTIANQLLNYIIPVLITIAVVYFIWGVVQYLIAGDEEKKKKSKSMIIGGLIGLFIIVSFWGIIKIVSTTFVDPEARPDIIIQNL